MRTPYRSLAVLIAFFLVLISCTPPNPWLLGFEKTELNPILTLIPAILLFVRFQEIPWPGSKLMYLIPGLLYEMIPYSYCFVLRTIRKP